MSESLISAASQPEWAAFAAIDWAGQKNSWRLVRGIHRGPGPFPDDSSAR
jgi:hypothetical protein